MRFHEKPPPATYENLAAWEAYFRSSMPEQLRNLLSESDGPVLYRDDTQKELQIFGASQAVEYYQGYKFGEYLPDCIPICLDGSGIFAVYRLREMKISDIWAVESGVLAWEEGVRLCSDIDELIARDQPIENAIREQDTAGQSATVE